MAAVAVLRINCLQPVSRDKWKSFSYPNFLVNDIIIRIITAKTKVYWIRETWGLNLMFLGLPLSKNASSRRTAAHCAETIRIKNDSTALVCVSTQSQDIVCSCSLQHLHHHHLTKTLSPALVLIVLQQWFRLLPWLQPLSEFAYCSHSSANFLSDR